MRFPELRTKSQAVIFCPTHHARLNDSSLALDRSHHSATRCGLAAGGRAPPRLPSRVCGHGDRLRVGAARGARARREFDATRTATPTATTTWSPTSSPSYALDTAGNLFISDGANHRVRRVAAGTGLVTTVAGNGVAGFSGDGGAATSASLQDPYGVAFDAAGNMFVGEFSNHRVRNVSAHSGVISTVAGNGLLGFSGDGGAATSASCSRCIRPTRKYVRC